MKFYAQGRKDGDFEAGIRMALQAILASPHFLFRLEEAPATARAGQNYRITDLDLASRLSFFLWGAGPDDELLKVAQRGTLRGPGVLAAQVKRMLADPQVRRARRRGSRRSGCACRTSRRSIPTRCCFRTTTTSSAKRCKQRNRALLRQHRPRGSQRPRSAHRRLHVRERAHRAALRHPERQRRRLPARHAGRREPPRPARPGQHPDADVGRRSHVAGAARQVGHGSAARRRRRRRRRRTCRCSTKPRPSPRTAAC